ncbi:septin 7b [Brienomyrus brachyistius]|uniref:septin 7b n=1 Tax=Brienomyrus brachyistius TaxID=42636 RepID=UPI0020B1D277|nr:septin 7b [Brienomyrus brachyistius]
MGNHNKTRSYTQTVDGRKIRTFNLTTRTQTSRGVARETIARCQASNCYSPSSKCAARPPICSTPPALPLRYVRKVTYFGQNRGSRRGCVRIVAGLVTEEATDVNNMVLTGFHTTVTDQTVFHCPFTPPPGLDVAASLLLPVAQQKNLEGYVGFANLPNQVYRKSVKRGFEFTLMVVGESGLGKSTLINSLFLTDLYSSEYPGPSHRIKQTVQVEQSKVLVKEGGVQLLLTIVDTPGFGDAVDNSNCWQPVIDHIDSKFEDYLNAESRVNRRQMPDSRVHCCLYFIAPSGHGLKPLDIEFMKRLHEKVNIIPLIAKADTLTPEECQQFKKQIMREIQEHKIKIYEFPEVDDEEESKLVKKIKDRLPLAVVGSNTTVEVNGKRVRGRQYPWGVAEVENGEHCDFTILRNMLIRTHMQDLKDVTNNVHYENYRSRKLAAVTYNGVENDKNKSQLTKLDTVEGISPLAQMEEERREHVTKMKKMEMEMEQVFEMKVKEKIQKLKDSEAELQRRHEQMKKNLEAQHKELEEKRRQLEEDKSNWETQRQLEQQKLDATRTLEKNKKKGKIF